MSPKLNASLTAIFFGIFALLLADAIRTGDVIGMIVCSVMILVDGFLLTRYWKNRKKK